MLLNYHIKKNLANINLSCVSVKFHAKAAYKTITKIKIKTNKKNYN